MKFYNILLLVSAASAQRSDDDFRWDAKSVVGTDCNAKGKFQCYSSLVPNMCCGTAKKDTTLVSNKATDDVKVCQLWSMRYYTDPNASDKRYTFRCDTAGSKWV